MKKVLSTIFFMSLTLALTACPGGSSDSPPSSAPTSGDPQVGTQNEGWFNGAVAQFHVDFGSPVGAPLRNRPMMMYTIELKSKTPVRKGQFVIYDCHDANCTERYPLFRADCNFDVLTCRLTDSMNHPVQKGGQAPTGEPYLMDAGDLAQIQSLDHCDRIEGGEFGECTYVTIVDPRLRPVGFFDQYFAAEFVPRRGPRSALSIYHLQTGR